MAANVQIPSVAATQLQLKECHSWAELEEVLPEWRRILQMNRSLGLFSSPEWLGPWWQAYSARKELLALIMMDAGRVVAILPMYVERFRHWLPVTMRSLRLVGDGSRDSDNLDFVVQPGYEEAVVSTFVRWATKSEFHICEFNCVSPDSLVIRLMRECVTGCGWNCNVKERPTAVVPLPATWDAYLKQLSSKERGKVGNRYRHLQTRYAVEFYRCERMEELPAALEALFRLHQKRWEAKREPGSFRSAERRLFYYNMGSALLAKGQLELWVLRLNGEAVAAQMGMRYGDKVHSLQEGFDPAYASDSVGYVLRSHVLRNCIEAGVRYYDFLAGDQESKQRWGALTGSYTDLHFAPRGGKGSAHIKAAQMADLTKSLMKERLPEPVLKGLLALRSRLR